MKVADFNLKTLRQARGSLRAPAVKSDRHISILRVVNDGAWLTLKQIAAALDMVPNSLCGTITLMVYKHLLDRIGDKGDYRYKASKAGQALLEAME